MFQLLLTPSLKVSLPSGALCSLFGPRTCTARSTTCATASLHRRHQQVRRLLKRVEHTRPNGRGYIQLQIKGKWHYVHRLVMELLLARPLAAREHVHHLDGNRTNNHPRNLQLLSHGAHTILTHQKHPLVAFCAWCGRPFLASHGREGRRTQHCCVSCANRHAWAEGRRSGRRRARGRVRRDPAQRQNPN